MAQQNIEKGPLSTLPRVVPFIDFSPFSDHSVASERIGHLNTSLLYAGLMGCSLISQLTDGWCLTLSKAFQKSIVKSRTCTASVIAAVI